MTREEIIKNKGSLRGADLRGANLRGADLRGADLRDANLYGADLYGAIVEKNQFEDIVLGIGLCIHESNH